MEAHPQTSKDELLIFGVKSWEIRNGEYRLIRNPRKRRGCCKVRMCRNESYNGKPLCNKCQSREFRANNPDRYAFNALKDSAKKRGIPFGLSFEEFRAFCLSHPEYLPGRGRRSFHLHLDRIDASRGYFADNIQVLSATINIQKRNSVDYRKPDDENQIDIPF